MVTVTLISDWADEALYVSQLVGALLNLNEKINFVNLSQGMKNYDILKTAYILKYTYLNYPKGSIHLCLTENYSIHSNEFLLYTIDNQFIVCRNNGLLSIAFDNIKQVYNAGSCNILEEIKFVTSIVESILTNKYNQKYVLTENIEKTFKTRPVTIENSLTGHIEFIDCYGNLITNITKNDFYQFVGIDEFKIVFLKESLSISQISTQYSDVETGEYVAFFNSLGFLELAINKGSLSNITKLEVGNKIRIEKHTRDKNKENTLF